MAPILVGWLADLSCWSIVFLSFFVLLLVLFKPCLSSILVVGLLVLATMRVPSLATVFIGTGFIILLSLSYRASRMTTMSA